MKFLFHCSAPWPYCIHKPISFPNSNRDFVAEKAHSVYKDTVELMVKAEQCGFDIVSLGEEHMNVFGIVPNPCVLLGAVATQTKYIEISALGCPIPILNPVRVAEEYAMLDILSRHVQGSKFGTRQLGKTNGRNRILAGNSLIPKSP